MRLRNGANEGQSESRGTGRRGKSIPAWLMSRGMIDSPIRAMPGPYAFTCSLAPGFPYSPFSRHFSSSPPHAFISLRAVQFIPHSRTVRTPMATTFNKYRINAFTARRTDISGPIQTPRRRRVNFTDRILAFYRIFFSREREND